MASRRKLRNRVLRNGGAEQNMPVPPPPPQPRPDFLDAFARQTFRLWVENSDRRTATYFTQRLNACAPIVSQPATPFFPTPTSNLEEYARRRVAQLDGRWLMPADIESFLAAARDGQRRINDLVRHDKPMNTPQRLNDALLGYISGKQLTIDAIEAALADLIMSSDARVIEPRQQYCSKFSRSNCPSACTRGFVSGCTYSPPTNTNRLPPACLLCKDLTANAAKYAR